MKKVKDFLYPKTPLNQTVPNNLQQKTANKLTESETCLCLKDPVFVVKAASSDSSDSNWSVVDNNPDNMLVSLVSSFISSAILAVHDPSPRLPHLPQAP